MASSRSEMAINRSRLFTFLAYSMDEELYYNRIFLRPRREIVFPRVDDPLVMHGPLVIFVHEAIDYTLSTRFSIDEWPMPLDMVRLRIECPDKIYFNTMIGRAICHYCTVKESNIFAREGGFSLSDWSIQTPLQATEYVPRFLNIVRERTRPVNISILYMLAFAGQLVFEALTFGKPELIEVVCQSTVYMFHRTFPYEWIYWNTRLWALTFNAVHNDLHQTWVPGHFHHNLA